MRRMSKLFASLATFGTAVVVFLSANPAFAQGRRRARRSRQVARPGRGAGHRPVRARRRHRSGTRRRLRRRGHLAQPAGLGQDLHADDLGLALIESLVIYGLLIAFLLYGKIG